MLPAAVRSASASTVRVFRGSIQSSSSRCVCFATIVADDPATLATGRALPPTRTGLPPAGSRQLRLAHANALYSPAGSEQAHFYGSILLAPGERHGCTSGCWHPDGTLPVDLRDHRHAPGALCRHDPGTADRHHADRLWLDQPGDSGGSVPPALDQLLLDGSQGQVRLEGHGPCLVPDRDAGVPIRTLRRGRRRYPDPAGVRGG